MRRGLCPSLAFAVLAAWLPAAPAACAPGASPCADSPQRLEGLGIRVPAAQSATAATENPLAGERTGGRYRACWLTRELAAAADVTCAKADPARDDLRAFRFGYCTPSPGGGEETLHWTDPRFDAGDLASASRFVVSFEPRAGGPTERPVFLRLEHHDTRPDPACEGKTKEQVTSWRFAVNGHVSRNSAAHEADPQCSRSAYKLDGLPIWSEVDKLWDKTAENPLAGVESGGRYRVCWLTREQAANPDISCAKADPSVGDLQEFRFGYCAAHGDAPKTETVQWTDPRFDTTDDLAGAGHFVIRFEPRSDGPRPVPVYLRVERRAQVDDPTCPGKKKEEVSKWHFSVNAWVPAQRDRRFKLDIHAGISQFSAAGAFADSFAEMRLRSEVRLWEHCLGQPADKVVKKRETDARQHRSQSRDGACILDDEDGGPERVKHFETRAGGNY